MDKIRISDFATIIAKKLNDSFLSEGIRSLWLDNYVESVLR